MEDYSHLVHDSRIDKVVLDFNSNTIKFLLTWYGEEVEKTEVEFGGVINQDFQYIDKDNIIFGIEETDWGGLQIQFPDLMGYYKHYKSISEEDKDKIEKGIAKCFHIRGSAGLEGYIIAETIKFEKITSANNV